MKKFLVAAGLLAVVVGARGLGLAEEGHQHQAMGKTEMTGKSCPMGSLEKCCPAMVKGADVAIEKIPEGVTMKVTAKDAKTVAAIQEAADKLKECKPDKKSAVPAKVDDKDEIVACPVMGTKMKKSKTYEKTEYKGKTYYFCCPMCKPEFLKNPEKYTK